MTYLYFKKTIASQKKPVYKIQTKVQYKESKKDCKFASHFTNYDATLFKGSF